ncbi:MULTISPECIES: UvrD-helicase domain-containing protein [unclassified Paenibacillus]|uniref:UvrD-helicase domain-containing protein n=1 Tax=unclassified Paenibacillus TaxID=185978 RepID=UPI002404B58B|nr:MULTISPECIES: UvrD-helicase domain-containing protein [unclassified Paenibacillus]
MITEKTKALFTQQHTPDIVFRTFKDLLLSEVGIKEAIIIEFEDFERWMYHEQFIPDQAEFTIRDVWLEINSILKGTITQDGRILSKASYLTAKESYFNEASKKEIYHIASRYEIWLKLHEYYDYNDLVYLALQKESVHVYSNIVFDEIQELTARQLEYLMRITSNKQNLLMLGDIHQVTDQYMFNLPFLKNKLYAENYILKENYIYKNYRSGDQTVHWTNELKNIKFNLLSHEKEEFRIPDESVRKGSKPNVYHGEIDSLALFSQIEQDADSIVVVGDSVQKQKLEDNGLKRIFTIEETRGLEYKTVYGFNLLSNFNVLWRQLFQSGQRAHYVYSTYFNLIYLAVTRSKETLYFIESERTIIEDKLEAFFAPCETIAPAIQSGMQENDQKRWLDEANRLFKLRKYEKAADAYERAEQFEKRDSCLKLAHHKLLYEYNEKFKCFIQLSTDKCSPQILRIMLDCIEKKYSTSIVGAFQILLQTTPRYGIDYRRMRGFLEPDWTNTEKAACLYERISQSIFNRNEIIFVVTLFKEDKPLSLETCNDKGHQDISIKVHDKSIKIHSATLTEQRKLEEHLNWADSLGHDKTQAIKGEYGFQFIEENKLKYEKSKAEDILDMIFKDKDGE